MVIVQAYTVILSASIYKSPSNHSKWKTDICPKLVNQKPQKLAHPPFKLLHCISSSPSEEQMSAPTTELPVEVLNFDSLHGKFRIHSKSAKLILGIHSNTTLWRRRKEDGFPKPDRFNTYSVADIRNYLNAAPAADCTTECPESSRWSTNTKRKRNSRQRR